MAGLWSVIIILSLQTIHHPSHPVENNDETLDKNFNFQGDPQSSVSSTAQTDWLDSVLGQSKQGIFSADFEEENNTWVERGDGDNITLDCRVFLKQEKTVGIICASLTFAVVVVIVDGVDVVVLIVGVVDDVDVVRSPGCDTQS